MPRPFRPDDLHDLRSVSDVRISPDGTAAAYVVAWPDRDTDANRAEIHLRDLSAGSSRQLTRAHRADLPRWSPDGTRLAYRACAHEAKPTLMMLDLAGGEPVQLAAPDDGVTEFEWIDDDSLVFVAPVRPDDQIGVDDEELARRPRVIEDSRYRFNGRGWTHDRRTQLHVVGVDSHVRQLTSVGTEAGAAAPSPDGSQIAFISSGLPEDEFTGGREIYLVPTAGGEPRRVGPAGGSWWSLRWVDDGRMVAIGKADSTQVAIATLHLVDVADDSITSIDDGDVGRFNLLAASGTVVPRGGAELELDAVACRRGAVHVERLTANSGDAARVLVGGDRQVVCFDTSPDGSLVVAGVTSATRPADLVAVKVSAAGLEETQLTDLNSSVLAELDLAPLETVEVTSADGYAVQAWVVRPPASAESVQTPGPGLVYVHGGPMAQYGYGFFDEFQVAAACGYTVIGANPRGSDGYGDKHASVITGAMGGVDWEDVQAVTDHLAGLDSVDGSRIGIGGGSYGGFMASWAIGHTDRYAAALVERAVTNWETFQGTSDIGSFFPNMYVGGWADDGVERLREQSPTSYTQNMVTPTLIVHSEEDWRCPPEQAEQLFVALRRRGVPTRFVRFPGENHELTRSGRPSHRVERFGIVHDWWAEHLGGAPIS